MSLSPSPTGIALEPPGRPEPTPVSDFLLALAPPDLPYKRTSRYLGDSLCANLSEFAFEDQAITLHVYAFLQHFLDLLAPYPVDEGKWLTIENIARHTDLNELVGAMQRLGDATRGSSPLHSSAARAIHDLRGGGLTAVLGRLQIIALGLERPGSSSRRPGELNTFFILARDHLKITRNAITGLDDEKRDADRASKFHNVATLVEKWQNAIPGLATRDLPVRVVSRFHGNMSECCLESAAVDRICYNLVNNACRHCAAGPVQIDIFRVPGEPHGHLRFVVSNHLGPRDNAELSALSDEAMARLFQAGVSSTGSGLGLGIVAEFVAQAFGLRNKDEAVTRRYVGARVHDGWFYAWFHWPVARDAPSTPEGLL